MTCMRRRIAPLVDGEPRFIGAPHLGSERLLPVARCCQRLLRGCPRSELSLKRSFHRAPVDLSPLVGDLRDQRLLLRDLRLDTFAAAVELDNALAARSLGEAGLLRCALGEPRALASPGQRSLRFIARAARAFLLLRRLRQLPPADVD